MWANFKATAWSVSPSVPLSQRTVGRVHKHEAKMSIFKEMMGVHKADLKRAASAVDSAQRKAAAKKAALTKARKAYVLKFASGRPDATLKKRIHKMQNDMTKHNNALKHARTAKKSTTTTLKRVVKALAREQKHLARNKARLNASRATKKK